MATQQTLQFRIVLAIVVAIGLAAAATTASDVNIGQLPADDRFVARGHSARLDCDAEAHWQRAVVAASTAVASPTGASANSPLKPAAALVAVGGVVEARWLFNGEPLTQDDGRWKIYKNGTLVIPKFGKRPPNTNGTAVSEGLYQCLVANQRYGVLLTRTIHLRIAYLKEFLRQPEDTQVRIGQPTIIPCSINSLPKATVVWERDGTPLPQNIKYVPLPSGSLLITNVHSSDEGSYRCKVINTILKKTKKSKAGALSIVGSEEDNGGDVPPTSIVPLDVQSNVTALVGADVTLYCVVNGIPPPTIRWLNDDGIVVANSSIFTLRNITRDHTGPYTCSVFGAEGGLKKVYFVNVLEAPVFNSTPPSGVHTLALTIRLNCTATGYPAPQIRWFKNGRLFDVHAHVRAKRFDWGLLISSSTVSDSGVYQCLASNLAGYAWSSAVVQLNASSNGPSEPRDIQCLPYREDSVCLRWRGEPDVQAYNIIAHKTGDTKTLDYLTNETYKLVDNLYAHTNYTFLIRTFNRKASTEFANVTCATGVVGVRNFTAQLASADAMLLAWQPRGSDYNPCAERKNRNYVLQWRRTTSHGVNSIDVAGFEQTIVDLQPGEIYEFRVKSAMSTLSTDVDTLVYSMPDVRDMRHQVDNDIVNDTDSDVLLSPPPQLDATVVTTSSVNVSWMDRNPQGTMYSVCYVARKEELSRPSCEHSGRMVKRLPGSSVLLEGLRPKTEYEVRVRAHHDWQLTSFSHSLLVTTPSDVPSEVQGLEYKVLTPTSACVKWEPPSQANGRITKYAIRHTANLSLPTEKWLASSILIPRNNDGCWNDDSDGIVLSTVLHDLDPELFYHVHVVAVNDAGSGAITPTITISTKYPFFSSADDLDDGRDVDQDDLFYRQGIGVALGFGIALICIFACVGGYFVHKYIRTRFSAERRYPPNVGPYAPSTTRPKPANGHACRDAHEMQHLVETNGHSRIPIMPATILDTKGGSECPNGIHNKTGTYLNGHATNLRITENPSQYYKPHDVISAEEVAALNAPRRGYEEDTNSNLQKICPATQCYNIEMANGNGVDANATQITILLDDSVSSTSLTRQPTLEPNG